MASPSTTFGLPNDFPPSDSPTTTTRPLPAFTLDPTLVTTLPANLSVPTDSLLLDTRVFTTTTPPKPNVTTNPITSTPTQISTTPTPNSSTTSLIFSSSSSPPTSPSISSGGIAGISIAIGALIGGVITFFILWKRWARNKPVSKKQDKPPVSERRPPAHAVARQRVAWAPGQSGANGGVPDGRRVAVRPVPQRFPSRASYIHPPPTEDGTYDPTTTISSPPISTPSISLSPRTPLPTYEYVAGLQNRNRGREEDGSSVVMSTYVPFC